MGIIFRDNFDNSSIDTVNWQVVTAAAGTVVEGASGIDLDSPATTDASAINYKTAFDRSALRTISLKFIPNSINPDTNYTTIIYDAAAVPSATISNITFDANRHVAIWTRFNDIIFQRFDTGGTQYRWSFSSATWVSGTSGIAYANYTPGTLFRTELESDGTSWRIILYDSGGSILETTSWVTWASTRTTNTSWIMLGDVRTGAVSQDVRYTQFILSKPGQAGGLMGGGFWGQKTLMGGGIDI